MKNDRICHRISIKNEKERELYRRRQEKALEGTPKIILGKAESSSQQIWTEDLKNEPVTRLKESNATDKAKEYARTIAGACCSLAQQYGFFILNQNMVFSNPQRELFTWINPDIRENHVKIYLPHSHEGELAMIRSILTYFKLWLKCDYSVLAEVKTLAELVSRLESVKFNPSMSFKGRSPEREFLVNRRNSINLNAEDIPQRGQNLLAQNKSMKDMMGRSPGKDSDSPNFLTSSLSNKMSSPLKFAHQHSHNEKNKTTLVSEKACEAEFDHRTFNNINQGMMMTPLNKSVGVKGGSHYYPNKTTSNRANSKHHIVAMINQQDSNPNEYGKNKILLDEKRMAEHQMEMRCRGKQSLDGIGQQLNDLFVSSIENEEEGQQVLKQVQQQFNTILD